MGPVDRGVPRPRVPGARLSSGASSFACPALAAATSPVSPVSPPANSAAESKRGWGPAGARAATTSGGGEQIRPEPHPPEGRWIDPRRLVAGSDTHPPAGSDTRRPVHERHPPGPGPVRRYPRDQRGPLKQQSLLSNIRTEQASTVATSTCKGSSSRTWKSARWVSRCWSDGRDRPRAHRTLAAPLGARRWTPTLRSETEIETCESGSRPWRADLRSSRYDCLPRPFRPYPRPRLRGPRPPAPRSSGGTPRRCPDGRGRRRSRCPDGHRLGRNPRPEPPR